MTHASDSTYAAPPIGDSGQSTPSTMHDQVYAFPADGGTGGGAAVFENQYFAPSANTTDLLPPFSIESEGQAPYDAMYAQADPLPPDAAAGQESMPGGLSGAETGANPWDTYKMNPVAETQGLDGVSSESVAPQQVSPEQVSPEPVSPEQASLEQLSPEQAIPQLEQALQTQFEEVVKLGTSGDLSQPEAQAQLQTALNSLLETAVNLGAAREFVQAGQQLPTEGVPAEQAFAEQMPTEQMPAEQMPAEQMPAEQMPAEQMPAEQMPAEQMPTEQAAAEQMPTEQMPAEQMPAEQMPAEQMPQESLPTDTTAALPEGAAGQTDIAPLEQNPYEPQVPPVSPDAAASYQDSMQPPATGGTEQTMGQDQMQFTGQEQSTQPVEQALSVPGGSDLNLMQDQLHSQVQQLLTLAVQAQPSAGNPADPANSGTVDNFKTALLNVVKTAHEIGAQGIAQQGITQQGITQQPSAEPVPATTDTSMG